MEEMAYSYSDIWLTPHLSRVTSRQTIDTTWTLGGNTFKVPVIPANMVDTIDQSIAEELVDSGNFYIYHRFRNTYKLVKDFNATGRLVSISVGVNDRDRDLVKQLANEQLRCDYITIDVAHGHSLLVAEMIPYIRLHFPHTFIIAGNVCTQDGTQYLEQHGADCVKVGIGQGGACTTKFKTGFTMPMFTAVNNCAWGEVNVPIIADGGVKHNGDIAKAIVAGATAVMAGGVFAQLSQSPAGRTQQGEKIYSGSASTWVKRATGRDERNIEGTTRYVQEVQMSYLSKIQEIQEDLQSAISYAGGNRLNDLRLAKYVVHHE